MSNDDRPWIVITGTSSGIGAAMLDQISNDYRVLSIARRDPASTATVHVNLDISDFDAPGWKVIADLLRNQPIQGIAHMAGELGERGALMSQNTSSWRKVFDVTLAGMLELTQICWPGLNRVKDSRIVLATSGAARNKVPHVAAYGVAKAAMERFAEVLAIESGSTGPRVVVVNPGPTATPMRAKVMPNEDPATLPTPKAVAAVYVAQLLGPVPEQGSLVQARQWLEQHQGYSFN